MHTPPQNQFHPRLPITDGPAQVIIPSICYQRSVVLKVDNLHRLGRISDNEPRKVVQLSAIRRIG